MNRFVVILISVLTTGFLVIGFRLTGIGPYSWAVACVSLGLMLLFRWGRNKVLPPAVETSLRTLIYINMGLLSLLLPQIILRDFIFIPLQLLNPNLFQFAFSTAATFIMLGVSVIFLIYGFWNVTRGPHILKVHVPIQQLSKDLEDYTIIQISDLHAGPGISTKYVDRVVNQALVLNGDVLVLTGDIADGNFERYRPRIESLAKLSQRGPVLYITGNHEYYKDSAKWTAEFKKLGARVLLNEHIQFVKGKHSVLFVGVTDPAARSFDSNNAPNLKKALENHPQSSIQILLAHQPDIAPEACPHFDLQLSGHTHAGQFFPWSLVIQIFQPFTKGLKKCGSMWVYTNSGTGFWGPPFRIGTRSEITQLILKNKE